MFKNCYIFIIVFALSMLLLSACSNNAAETDPSLNSSKSETMSTESTPPSTTKRPETSTAAKPETTTTTKQETTTTAKPETTTTITSTIPESTPLPSSYVPNDLPNTGTISDEASAESPETISPPKKDEPYVYFKIVDSAGNPIPNVYIYIDQRADITIYSNNKGMIRKDFTDLGLGKHSIEIVETNKINKSITYEINVESLPAEFTLIWDFGNPNKIAYQPKSTATLIFRDKDGKPVKGHLVCASYFLVMSENGEGFDRLEEIGRLDENGQVVWKDPPPDTAEIQVLDDQNNLYLYDLTLSHDSGNTDYYFYWQEGALKE